MTLTTTSSLLEALRAALYAPPSLEGWLAVCDLIDGALQADDLDDADLRLAIDYTSRLAEPWPDRLRVAPEGWRAALSWEQQPSPAAHPTWSLIRHLDLTGDMRGAQIGRVIASSDLLTHVKILTLDEIKLGQYGVRALSRATTLEGLTHLSLRATGLGPQDVRTLCTAGVARHLTHLDLSDNALRANALRPLATSHLERLTHLILSKNRIADACCPHLLAWNRLPHLEALDLSHNNLAYHAARQLAAATSTRCDLDMSHNRLRDSNAEALIDGTDPQRRAERVDELLDAAPDLTTWQALCTIFDVWPAHDHDGLRHLIADNARRLDRWPDDLRTPQPRWIRALMEDLHGPEAPPLPPQWAAVRSLSCRQFVRYGGQPFPWLGRMVERLALRLDDLALTHLDLSALPTDVEQISALLARPAASSLRQLHINWSHLGQPLAQALAASPHLNALKDLSLDGQDLGARCIGILFQNNNLSNITRLSLVGNSFHDEGAQILARAPHLSRLTRLNLTSTSIQDAGALALAEAVALGSLWRLEANACPITARGVVALATGTGLPALRSLSLSTCHQVPARQPSIAAPRQSLLTALDLSNRQIKDDDLRAILDGAHLDHLQGLALSSNALTDRAAELLASNPRLSALKSLRLDNNAISDEGARALADAPHLRSLALLGLGSNKIQARGAIALLSAPGLPAMTHLNLGANPVPASIKRDLKDLKPAPSLAHLFLPPLWDSPSQPDDAALADSLHMGHVRTGHDPTWQGPLIPP